MTTSSENSSKKLEWCKRQRKHVQLQEPNKNTAKEYLQTAKETIELANIARQIKSKVWEATHKYYALYFCAYALLTRAGIKSEIHDCTIALIETLEQERTIKTSMSKQLKKAKQQRIDNQYHLKNQPVITNQETLNKHYLETKKTIEEMTTKQLATIREHINKP